MPPPKHGGRMGKEEAVPSKPRQYKKNTTTVSRKSQASTPLTGLKRSPSSSVPSERNKSPSKSTPAKVVKPHLSSPSTGLKKPQLSSISSDIKNVRLVSVPKLKRPVLSGESKQARQLGTTIVLKKRGPKGGIPGTGQAGRKRKAVDILPSNSAKRVKVSENKMNTSLNKTKVRKHNPLLVSVKSKDKKDTLHSPKTKKISHREPLSSTLQDTLARLPLLKAKSPKPKKKFLSSKPLPISRPVLKTAQARIAVKRAQHILTQKSKTRKPVLKKKILPATAVQNQTLKENKPCLKDSSSLTNDFSQRLEPVYDKSFWQPSVILNKLEPKFLGVVKTDPSLIAEQVHMKITNEHNETKTVPAKRGRGRPRRIHPPVNPKTSHVVESLVNDKLISSSEPKKQAQGSIKSQIVTPISTSEKAAIETQQLVQNNIPIEIMKKTSEKLEKQKQGVKSRSQTPNSSKTADMEPDLLAEGTVGAEITPVLSDQNKVEKTSNSHKRKLPKNNVKAVTQEDARKSVEKSNIDHALKGKRKKSDIQGDPLKRTKLQSRDESIYSDELAVETTVTPTTSTTGAISKKTQGSSEAEPTQSHKVQSEVFHNQRSKGILKIAESISNLTEQINSRQKQGSIMSIDSLDSLDVDEDSDNSSVEISIIEGQQSSIEDRLKLIDPSVVEHTNLNEFMSSDSSYDKLSWGSLNIVQNQRKAEKLQQDFLSLEKNLKLLKEAKAKRDMLYQDVSKKLRDFVLKHISPGAAEL